MSQITSERKKKDVSRSVNFYSFSLHFFKLNNPELSKQADGPEEGGAGGGETPPPLLPHSVQRLQEGGGGGASPRTSVMSHHRVFMGNKTSQNFINNNFIYTEQLSKENS